MNSISPKSTRLSPSAYEAQFSAGQRRVRWWGRVFTAVFAMQTLLPVLPILPGASFGVGQANAQVTAAPGAPAGQRPIMDAAQNGVPIVNIAPPSASGVSRNQYQDFNVGRNGLILNNSNGNTSTQLGGVIAGNMQLGVVPARIILNEVVSANPSSLRGFIEVAGRRADIVIANPNGITCDGCGFINTAGRATLSTGAPQFDASGAITSFNVNRGQLTIGSQGLNASNLEQLDLLARNMVIEGEVLAKNLTAIAGANQVLYGTLQASPQAPGDASAPRFAIDIKDLGGMYANQVFIIATDKGLGVNSTGRLASLQGGFTLSSAGDLTLKDTYSAGSLALSAQGNTRLTGQTGAQGAASINTTGSLVQLGVVQAGGPISANATSITNSGDISQYGAGTLSLNASQSLVNTATIYSAGNLSLAAPALQNTAGQLLAEGDISVQSSGPNALNIQDSRILSGGSIALTAAGPIQLDASTLNAQGNLTVEASGAAQINNSTVQSGGATAIRAAALTNRDTSVLANQTLAITTPGDVVNIGGRLMAAQDLSISANSLVNTSSVVGTTTTNGLIASDSRTQITTSGSVPASGNSNNGLGLVDANTGVYNQNGTISGKTATDIQTNSQALDNRRGVIVSDGQLNLRTGVLHNQQSLIASRGLNNTSVDITSSQLNNQEGTIDAGNSLRINSSGDINNSKGAIQAGSATSATPTAPGDLSITAAALNNTAGRILGQGGVNITASSLTNLSATISASAGRMTVTTSDINNQAGRIVAADDLQISARAIDNTALAGQTTTGGANSGVIASNQNLTINAASINNQQALVVAGNQLAINLTGDLNNARGSMQSNGTMALTAAAVNNQNASLIAGAALQADIASLDNSQGAISAGGPVTLSSTGSVTNTLGQILSNAALELRASSVNNSQGTISALATAIIVGTRPSPGDLNNQGGRIIGAQSTWIRSASVNNQDGIVFSGGPLTLRTEGQAFNNTSGIVQSLGNLDFNTGALNNSQGLVSGQGRVTVTSAALNNDSGEISALQSPPSAANAPVSLAINTQGQAVANNAGRIISQGDLTLQSADLQSTNQAAIYAQGNATVTVANLRNNDSLLQTGGQLRIQSSASIDNQNGAIDAGTALSINATSALDNRQGLVQSGSQLGSTTVGGGTLALQSASLDNRAGQIISRDQLTLATGVLRSDAVGTTSAVIGARKAGANITATTLSNLGSSISAQGNVNLVTTALDNQGGEILTSGNLSLDSQGQSLNNQAGRILADGNLTLQTGALNNSAGSLASNATLTVNATSLNNSAGTVSANITNLALGQGALNNTSGRIFADQSVNIQSATLTNTLGLISSSGKLTINAQGSTVDNNTGTIVANDTLAINAGQLLNSNLGQIATSGNLDITASNLNNSATIRAGNNLSVTATSVTNSGTLQADNILRIQAGDINNSGEISSLNTTIVKATGTLSNSGLIDGFDTYVQAGTVNNTGRIYGDYLAVGGGTVNNSGAGVIAARENLLIGAQALNNTGGALIYSLGDISIGGGFTTTAGVLTPTGVDGTMSSLVNASSTIEAKRNLNIKAASIWNRNDGLVIGTNTAGPYNEDLVVPRGWSYAFKLWECGGIGGAQKNNSCTHINFPDKFGLRQPVPAARTYISEQCSTDQESGIRYCTPASTTYTFAWNDPIFATWSVTPMSGPAPVEPGSTNPFNFGNGPIFPTGPFGNATTEVIDPPPGARPGWPTRSGGCSYEGYIGGGGGDFDPPQQYVRITNNTTACNTWRADNADWYARYNATLDRLETAVASYNTEVNYDNSVIATGIFEEYTWFHVDRYYAENYVVATAPAKLLAGNNMTMNGALTNQDSIVIAGQALSLTGNPNNIATQGQRRNDYAGYSQYTFIDCDKNGVGNCRDTRRYRPTEAYNPAPSITTFSLPTTTYQQYTAAPLSNQNLTMAALTRLPGTVTFTRTEITPDPKVQYLVKPSIGNTTATVAVTTATTPNYNPNAVTQVPAQGTGARARDVILTAPVRLTAPTSSLYRLNPNPAAGYLIETDPRFTNMRTFLSSDYYLQQLQLDPSRTLKRYGDGFLEQQLINDQVLALTGRRYLSGYTNTEDEYKALMNAGVLFAKTYQLSPGVALSAEQMALLTTDIVWLVEQSITLADGSVHRVLAPQVYIRRPQSGDLDQGGALIAANDIYINSPDNLVNSGRISANNSLTLLAGNNITNRGTISGNDIYARANNDLLNLGGRVIGTANGVNTTSTIALLAGRDVILQTTVQNTVAGTPGGGAGSSYSTRSQVDRVATIAGTNITVQAGRDVIGRAVQINADNNLGISAGRNVDIQSIANTYTMDARGAGPVVQGRTAFTKEANTTNTLSNLSAGNNLVIIAGTLGTPSTPATSTTAAVSDTNTGTPGTPGRITMVGTNLTAGNDLYLRATDIDIRAAVNSTSVDRQSTSRNAYNRNANSNETLAGGTILAGRNATMQADRDINLASVNLTAGGQAALTAGNNITIREISTTSTSLSESYIKTSKVAPLPVTSVSTRMNAATSTTVQGSAINADSVLILANNTIHITSSAVAGKTDTNIIAGQNLIIDAAQNTQQTASAQSDTKTGLFITSGANNTVSINNRAATSTNSTGSATQFIASNITSAQGSVNLTAQSGTLAIIASNASAAKDLNIQGAQVIILGGLNSNESETRSTNNTNNTDIGAVKPGYALNSRATGSSSDSATSVAATTLQGASITIKATGNPNAPAGEFGNGNISGITLAGVTAVTPGRLTLDAGSGTLALNVIQTSTSTSKESTQRDLLFQTMQGAGSTSTDAQYNSLSYGTLTVAAAQTTIQQGVNTGDSKNKAPAPSLQQLSSQPGMAWINDIQAQTAELAKNNPAAAARIEQVNLAQSQWDYKKQGLTKEGAAIVTLVVAYFTAGAASGAGAAASTAVGGGITGAIVGGATTAAVSALASQIAVSLINNKGNISAVLQEIGSKESMRGLVMAMVTGGALAGLGEALNAAGATGLNGTPWKDISAKSPFIDQLQKNLVNEVAGGVLRTAMTGGNSKDYESALQTSLFTAFINTGAAQGANAIGDAASGPNASLNAFTKQLAHALAGCVAGAATASVAGGAAKEGCSSGAIGAVVGELTATAFGGGSANLTADQRRDIINMSRLMSGVAAAITGGDINIASAAGGNAAENNRLLHPSERTLAQRLADKSGGRYTAAQIEAQLRLMGNQEQGVKPNTVEVLTGTDAIANSITQDPGMPKVPAGQLPNGQYIMVEAPANANANIQNFIMANTQNVILQTTYSTSNPALNGAETGAPNTTIPTAACGVTDANCRAGIKPTQNMPGLTELEMWELRNGIANTADFVGRTAGIVSNTSAAAAMVPGVHTPVAAGTAFGATVIDFGSQIVEQIVRPDIGKGLVGVGAAGAGAISASIPKIGPLIAPVTNEVIELWKNSKTTLSLQEWINTRPKK